MNQGTQPALSRRLLAWSAWCVATGILLYAMGRSVLQLVDSAGDMFAAHWRLNLATEQASWVFGLGLIGTFAGIIPLVLYVRAMRRLRRQAVFDAPHSPGNAYRVSGKPVFHFRDANQAINDAWQHFAMHLVVLACAVVLALWPMHLLFGAELDLTSAERGIRSIEVLVPTLFLGWFVASRMPLRRRVEKRIRDLAYPDPT